MAMLYKLRWPIELFFRWIKGHLRIKHYYGTSPNAVKTATRAVMHGNPYPSVLDGIGAVALLGHLVARRLNARSGWTSRSTGNRSW